MSLDELLNKDIMFLTNKMTQGRVSGSIGAKITADYIANELNRIGILPAGDDKGYFSYLDIFAARLYGEVKLSIGNRELLHRKEFGEVSRYSNPFGNFVNGELFIVRDEEDYELDELNGKILLISERPKGFDLDSTVKAVQEIGVNGILIEGGEPKWFPKGLMGSKQNVTSVFKLNKNVSKELENYQGQQVQIELPLKSESLKCQNVLGILKGTDTSKTIVLSAHYDHIGDDPNGHRFPGAVDNATGVSIILNLARELVNQTLPFNILFAFFTGEESGLLGAKHFLKNTNLPVNAAINVDSLGFEPSLIKMRNGHKSPGDWLADLSAEIIQKHGVDVAWISGGEDSFAFQNGGIHAIGLGQKPTDLNQRSIHTPDDSLDNLHFEPIIKGYHIVSELIQRLINQPELVNGRD